MRIDRKCAINLEQCDKLLKHIRTDFYIDKCATDQEINDISGCQWFAIEVVGLMMKEQTMTADEAIDGLICYLNAYRHKKYVREMLLYATAESDSIYKLLDL